MAKKAKRRRPTRIQRDDPHAAADSQLPSTTSYTWTIWARYEAEVAPRRARYRAEVAPLWARYEAEVAPLLARLVGDR